MKIYIFSFKSFLRYFPLLLTAALLISAVSLAGTDVLGVFSTGKELPIYCVETEGKKAAITFDCAWGADDILQILEVLRNNDVKASFFIVGQWAEKFPDKVKLIAAEGHDIANHSYSHLRMGALDQAKIASEIKLCSEKLEELSDGKMELFRPPYGDYSNSVVGTARKLGYYTIQWNVDSLDWKPGISREEILTRILSRINPGSIILFHNDTTYTAKLLPDIIVALKNMNYELLPVSQLILRDQFTIDHEGRQKKLD